MPKTKKLHQKTKKLLEQGKVFSPTYDLVFKSLLMDPQCRDYLIELIHGITKIPKEDMKEHLHIENSEHLIHHKNEKGKRSDMIISIKNNIINLEMNREYYDGLFEKNHIYSATLLSPILLSGQSYRDLKSVIQINFNNFQKFGEEVMVHFIKKSEVGDWVETRIEESYHISLEKIRKMYYNKEELSKLEKQLLLLGTDEIKVLEEISKDDEYMEAAKNKLINLTLEEYCMGIYDGQHMDQWEEKSKVEYAEKQGREEEQLKIAKKMKEKGQSVEFIQEMTGLSMEEIEQL